MEPWYKIATPRKEVREGRSFNPDEFAIHLEQVVARTAPEDYSNPAQFFARTSFTRALRDHAGMVLRRLSGQTNNTAPVMTLITQFGGGKTHTLTSLYHLVSNGPKADKYPGISHLLSDAGIKTVPQARVAVFVGNAWDPQDGRETPWIDIARQLAGDKGVQELGSAARTTPPGTEALNRIFQAAGAPVLLLFDEVLNFMNRHRGMSDAFHAFIQNLTVATTGTTHGVAVISLPRSQVEMTDYDLQWQDRITKVVRRVAKDLIANDESEISEVVRRRLFEDIGSEKDRKEIAKNYADWCFERRAQLPPEWTAVDTASTETKAKEYLRSRFESCFPFHPATLSVFQRKWQALPQYQQTRGTLAMLAQWISWAYRTGFTEARKEPLITLGSAPLDVPEFQSVMLGQLGESRLIAAIESDIAGNHSHAKALDVDSKGALRGIHQRTGSVILFESSGGQIDKVAHLPELRFALGEPQIDTTSIDNAAFALEDKSYFIRRVGSDGYKIGHQPTMKKVVNDRRASLDEETEIKPEMRKLVQKEFEQGASIPIVAFPPDSTAIPDSPRLTLVLLDPDSEYVEKGKVIDLIIEWTRQRGKSARLYPGSLVWCAKKPGRELRDKIEMWLAWKRVAREVADGTLGADFDRGDKADVHSKVIDAEDAAKDEIWGGYRYAVVWNRNDAIDLGAGHSSGSETLCGRVILALKSNALLNESIGAGYIERNWPPALRNEGVWPLTGLRQSFLDGSLTRLIDPDTILRIKLTEFISRGDFGLASGRTENGKFKRIWFNEQIAPDEITFENDVFLLSKERAKAVQGSDPSISVTTLPPSPTLSVQSINSGDGVSAETATNNVQTIIVSGNIPPELWNRLGTKLIPKMRTGELTVGVNLSVIIPYDASTNLKEEIIQILQDLGIADRVTVQ